MKILKYFKLTRIAYSLKTQLILYYTTFSLGVLLLGSYFIYLNIMGIIERQNEKLLLQQFRQSDSNISSLMNETDRLLKLFVQDDKIEAFLERSNFDNSYETNQMHKDILDKIADFISNDYSSINSIYFFTENNGEIGRNARNTYRFRDSVKELDFYKSTMYKTLLDAYPKTIWDGGYQEKFFNPQLINGNNYLFSAVKVTRSINNNSKKVVLVFNINERHVASLYSSGSGSEANNMYIIDKNGKILSSWNGQNIGTLSPVVAKINEDIGTQKDYGSFTSKKDNNSIQTVYYKMKESDWFIVGEIPLKLFSEDVAALQRLLFFIIASSITVIFGVSFFWLGKITEPLNALAGKMHAMSSGKLGLTVSRIPKNELGIVIKRFNEMSLSIVELVNKNEKIQEEKRRLEIEALQAQINPHFIYNTLNMIKWMAAMAKSKNIVESIVSLGYLIRPAYKSMDRMCALSEEIDYINHYSKIMNWRYGNGITVEFNIPENLMAYRLPRCILQPIVENAITHGMNKQENHMNISISAYLDGNMLILKIEDTGIGISEDKLKEINLYLSDNSKIELSNSDGSIGLYNVNRRITLNFGDKYGINVESRENEGTTVLIKLPML